MIVLLGRIAAVSGRFGQGQRYTALFDTGFSCKGLVAADEAV